MTARDATIEQLVRDYDRSTEEYTLRFARESDDRTVANGFVAMVDYSRRNGVPLHRIVDAAERMVRDLRRTARERAPTPDEPLGMSPEMRAVAARGVLGRVRRWAWTLTRKRCGPEVKP